MKVVYTKHAEDKLKRADVRKFKINKNFIEKILKTPRQKTKTKYGNYAALGDLGEVHDLRVIYDIIDTKLKVITFHIARRGRYET